VVQRCGRFHPPPTEFTRSRRSSRTPDSGPRTGLRSIALDQVRSQIIVRSRIIPSFADFAVDSTARTKSTFGGFDLVDEVACRLFGIPDARGSI